MINDLLTDIACQLRRQRIEERRRSWRDPSLLRCKCLWTSVSCSCCSNSNWWNQLQRYRQALVEQSAEAEVLWADPHLWAPQTAWHLMQSEQMRWRTKNKSNRLAAWQQTLQCEVGSLRMLERIKQRSKTLRKNRAASNHGMRTANDSSRKKQNHWYEIWGEPRFWQNETWRFHFLNFDSYSLSSSAWGLFLRQLHHRLGCG